MRRDLPRALFSTEVMSKKGQRRYLAIGRTGPDEPITCYQFSWSTKNSANHQLVYLYTGSDNYQLWRHYYQALAQAEKEGWDINAQADRPRVGEVGKLDL